MPEEGYALRNVSYIVAFAFIVTYRLIAFTIMPNMRPKVAPMAMDGTKIPAGTLQPYDITTKAVRATVARKRELTIGHW